MSMRDNGRASSRPVWMFMAATAMATTVSTLAATAMVKAESAQAVEVTCDCDDAQVGQCDGVAATAVQLAAAEVAPAPEAPVASMAAVAETDAPEESTRVRPASMKVHGALDKDIIRRIVRAHIDEVRYCYNEGLVEDPELAGRVTVQFMVGFDGKVADSRVASTDLEDSEVPECIANAVERWMFPKPASKDKVVITYPFVLQPG